MLGIIVMIAATGPQNFECSVQGSKLLAPPVAAADVCAQIAARTERARAATGPVQVAISFTSAGVANAQVTRRAGDHAEKLPDIAIATSDRPMDMHTVEMLADEIAQALTAR